MREAAAKLEISHLLERRPSQLSGGQRQRVALGRAMVRQPAVFLMDEPLSNLDAALRISMRAEIKHLHTAMQTTFVYVTHDQAEALTLADRIVVMNDGVVQQIGTPDEIYERPRNIVRRFVPRQPADQLSHRRDRDGRTARRLSTGRSAYPVLSGVGRAALGLWQAATSCSASGPRTCSRARLSRGHTDLARRVDSVLPVGSDRFLGLKVEGCDVFVRVDKQNHHQRRRSA